ncbi:MAG: PAC2 family protein [Haloarculaceae archaeon]
MTEPNQTVTFDRVTEIEAEEPTLIEGLPGQGLVAAIAVDLVTDQLGLEDHGNVVSDAFPPVTSFEDGRVRDLVRVYAGADPSVMTLQSDVALPPAAFNPLASSILEDLAPEFDRAIFLAGSTAESEDTIGNVSGVATDEAIAAQIRAEDIPLADGRGLIGGVTGALANACYHAEVPAAIFVVETHPFLPDPTAARSVIETALEPLVDFDIDTTELEEQAEQIREQMEQIAAHYRQMADSGRGEAGEPEGPTMFQ